MGSTSGPSEEESSTSSYHGPGRGAGRLLAGLEAVVVDVETTGFRPGEATIIEIGAVRLAGDAVTGEFFSLVDPAVPVPPDITTLTGISDEMVRRAPPAREALASFLAFARGAVLVAHNAPFDLGFLTTGCRAAGLDWPPAGVLDTAVLARLTLGPGQVPDCKLATLARYFGTQTAPRHRALADAQATAEVLAGLLGLIAGERAWPEPLTPAGPPPGRPLAAICA
jgi:DNA polymerase III subunit epsilon